MSQVDGKNVCIGQKAAWMWQIVGLMPVLSAEDKAATPAAGPYLAVCHSPPPPLCCVLSE